MKKLLFTILILFMASTSWAMTKAELVAEMEGKSYCQLVLGVVEIGLAPDDLKTLNDIKWYELHFFEVVGDVAISRKVYFYTYKEGLAQEKAYYKDQQPEQQIITP